MCVLEGDLLSPSASNYVDKEYDSPIVWLTHPALPHEKGAESNHLSLTALKNVIAVKRWAPLLSCDFSHIAALLLCTPAPPPPTSNTSPPAKYIGKQVIQGEWGLSPCRESQWVLRCCPSSDCKASTTSPTQTATMGCFCPTLQEILFQVHIKQRFPLVEGC